jgi:hypothetical protein
VTDAYSKKIMGYDLSDSLGASGAVRALRMADRGRMYRKKHADTPFRQGNTVLL